MSRFIAGIINNKRKPLQGFGGMNITAERIHNGYGWLPEGAAITLADDGTIVSVHMEPGPGAVFYPGILAPGFVNTHCHLELSHMKGVVPEHTGLIPFLKTIPRHRNDHTAEQKQAARTDGYNELLRNGIVAVGDIANTTDTLDLRALDGMHFCTFVESIGFTETNAAKSFGYALQTYNAFTAQQPGGHLLTQNIVPHAPYSVSASLLRMIDAHANGRVISIHNQESDEENRFFVSKEGHVRDLLSTLGIDDGPFQPSGVSSLQSYLPLLSAEHPVLFVHNTYTTQADIHFALSHLRQSHWCLCPNANLYIENTLPDIDLFISEGINICIGTDSLASNHGLSILDELCTIKRHYPHIAWEALFRWATINGAKALQMQDRIGSIEVDKKPGIIHITGLEDSASAPMVSCII